METKLESKLQEITEFLNKFNLSNMGSGIIDGKSGISEFYYYLSKHFNNDKFATKGFSIITDIVNDINKGYANPSFCSGLAGFGWYLETLVDERILKRKDIELLNALDNYIYRSMYKYICDGNFDYLHGGIGTALYFIKRLHKNSSKKNLEEFIAILEDKGTRFKDGSMAWQSQLSLNDNLKGFNFGMSHGQASIISFLQQCYIKGICKIKVRDMLFRSIQYLISNTTNDKNAVNYFPDWIHPDNTKNFNSRLAWCYGDLGIAMALYNAAGITNDGTLKKFSLEILQHSTGRRNLQKEGVIDAGICHGAFGIAHIFNRCFINTENEIFKITSDYWFNEGLKMSTFPDGYAGYKTWYTPAYGGWQPNASLIEGITGIGLSILSRISFTKPDWDKCLLLS